MPPPYLFIRNFFALFSLQVATSVNRRCDFQLVVMTAIQLDPSFDLVDVSIFVVSGFRRHAVDRLHHFGK